MSLKEVLSKNGPCKFVRYGCPQINDHALCEYQPMVCPVDPFCVWTGSILQLYDHCYTEHLGIIVGEFEFDLQLDQPKDDQLMVLINSVPFLFKLRYKGDFNLYYAIIGFVFPKTEKASYELIIDGIKVEVSCNIIASYRETSDFQSVSLTAFKHRVTILFDINVVKCGNCWRNCPTFIQNTLKLLDHQKLCQYRLYDCIEPGCKVKFNQLFSMNHLEEQHNYEYFFNTCTFKTSFSRLGLVKKFFTIENCEIISFACSFFDDFQSDTEEDIRIFRFVSNSTKVNADIKILLHFEHDHCKAKSVSYILRRPLRIYLEDLPNCFTPEEVLTVTAKVSTEDNLTTAI